MKEEMKDIGARTPRVSPTVSVLLALAARCEAEGPSVDLDAAIFLAIGKVGFEKQRTWDAPIPLAEYAAMYTRDVWQDQFTRNLEAAKRLVPTDPDHGGWFWRVGHGAENDWAHLNRLHLSHCDRGDETHAIAKTPELALCAAALRARAALAEQAREPMQSGEANPPPQGSAP